MRIPTNAGYDVWGGVIQGTPPKSNGILEYKHGSGKKQKLWVYEVQTGFSLSGTTGQSQKVRSFFPRNRVQQSFMVMCQCPNQLEYGQTVEWIRESQQKQSTSVRLTIAAKNMPVKGKGSPILAEGYIKSVQRKHSRFEYAPELQFEFLVERIYSPDAWKDTQEVTIRRLKSWRDIIDNQVKSGFIRIDPDASPVEGGRSMPPVTPAPGQAGKENPEMRPT